MSGNKYLFRAGLVSAFCGWLLSVNAAANPIVDGREWLQPSALFSPSWDEINAICESGECAGDFRGLDLTGWRWATAEEVGGLFAALTPYPGGVADYRDTSDLNFTSMFVEETGFLPTFTIGRIGGFVTEPVTLIGGWTSTASPTSGEFLAGIIASGRTTYSEPNPLALSGTRITTTYSNPPDFRAGLGGWFYRDLAAPVPAPNTLGLLALAALLLSTKARGARNSRRQTHCQR